MDIVQQVCKAISILGLITLCTGLLQCNPDYGPSGVYDCVPLKDYDHPQYATCITNSYAEMKTNYRYACREDVHGERPTYCWNQCMVELHDMTYGHVYNDCACTPGQHVIKYSRTTLTTPLPISEQCYTPTGHDCLWFRDCLNYKYSCDGTDYKELLELGINFCTIAPETKTTISENGSLWFDNAQKCFQVQMAPVLKQWLHLNCSTVENKATSVRNQCLSTPLGVISLCDLSHDDVWTIFWSIRDSLNKNLVPSILHVMNVIQNCSTLDKESNVTEMRLFFTPTINTHVTNTMIEKFLSKIVKKMSWQNEGIGWFGILSEQMTVHVNLAVRPNTDKNQEKQNGTSLDKALMKFANAFEDGEFQFNIQGTVIQLDKMFVCKDIYCEETYLHRNATYPELTFTSKKETENQRTPVIPSSQEEQEHEKQKPNFAIMEVGLFVGIIVAISFVLCFVRWLCKVFNKQRDTKHSNMVEDKDKNRRKIVKKKIGKDTIKVTIIHEKIQAFYRISGKQGEYRPGFLNLFKSEVKYRNMEE